MGTSNSVQLRAIALARSTPALAAEERVAQETHLRDTVATFRDAYEDLARAAAPAPAEEPVE